MAASERDEQTEVVIQEPILVEFSYCAPWGFESQVETVISFLREYEPTLQFNSMGEAEKVFVLHFVTIFNFLIILSLSNSSDWFWICYCRLERLKSPQMAPWYTRSLMEMASTEMKGFYTIRYYFVDLEFDHTKTTNNTHLPIDFKLTFQPDKWLRVKTHLDKILGRIEN